MMTAHDAIEELQKSIDSTDDKLHQMLAVIEASIKKLEHDKEYRSVEITKAKATDTKPPVIK